MDKSFIPSRLAPLSMSLDGTVAEAVACLSADAMQTAFVIDAEGVLRGIVTNGDFRRHMLAGGAMTDPVTACMNTGFTSVGLAAGRSDVAKRFDRGIPVLPRLDESGRLMEVITRDYEGLVHDTHLKILRDRANQQSADYIEQHLGEALLFHERPALWDFAMSHVSSEGLWAEFGVFTGGSINHFAAARPDQTLYGFDSFEGLKEAWPGGGAAAGAFDMGGRLPPVRANVTLVKGWFDQTLPAFLEQHPEPATFLHMDADTYPSTAMVLDLIGHRIGPGAVIVFDEYVGYPNWQNAEHRAWREFTERRGMAYRYLAFGVLQAAVQVL